MLGIECTLVGRGRMVRMGRERRRERVEKQGLFEEEGLGLVDEVYGGGMRVTGKGEDGEDVMEER